MSDVSVFCDFRNIYKYAFSGLWTSQRLYSDSNTRLDGRKWRVLYGRLSSLQFLWWFGEMKIYSHLWVIMHYKQGLRLSFLPVREINPCLKWACCMLISLLMDSQAIPLSHLTWGRSRDVWRMVFSLSLAAIEEAAAESMEPKNYRMV